MTDRMKGFLVHLDGDYRDDDAEVVAQAIRSWRMRVRLSMSAGPWVAGHEAPEASEAPQAAGQPPPTRG